MKFIKAIFVFFYAICGILYYLAALGSSIEDNILQKGNAASPKLTKSPTESVTSPAPKREIPPPKEPAQTQQRTETSPAPGASQSPRQPTVAKSPPIDPTIPSSGTEVLSFNTAKPLADQGDARAQAITSIYYAIGYKTDKDTAKATEYALLSAKQRNPLGIYRVAAMMENGDGFEKNPDEAKRLKELAFEGLNSMSGDPYAMTALGVMLFRGEGGLRQDREMAVKLYKKAADLGYAPAQYNYSVALALGQGAEVDMQESNRYWQMAYDQDYPPALKNPPEALLKPSTASSRQANELPDISRHSRPNSSQISIPSQDYIPRGSDVGHRPGFVRSPYKIDEIVDCNGLPSGTEVKCPGTGKIFLVP